jgi:hypothetical protein
MMIMGRTTAVASETRTTTHPLLGAKLSIFRE